MNNHLPLAARLNRNWGALKIAVIYLFIGSAWILFSDRLIRDMAIDKATLTTLSIYKGWGYILVTAILLYWLIRRHTARLRESENRLILALAGAQMSVWEWDLETNSILWSPEFFKITGVQKDASGSTLESFTNLIHPQDADRVRTSAEKALADQSLFAEEFRIIRPDGELRWLSNLGRAEYDSSRKHLQLIGTVQDITSRKRAENALRQSEEKYRLLFENNPLPMWIYDLETLKILKVNDAAVSHYGYSAAEFMSMTIKDIRPSEDVPKLLENVAHVTNGIDKAGIWRHRKKDGTLIQVEIVSHIIEFEGRRAELVLANDITERKRTEDELHDSEERFRQLADHIEEVFWITDARSGQEIYINSAAERIWGFSAENMRHTPNRFIEAVFPEDRDMVLRAIEKQRNGQRTELEYRIAHTDGSVRWIWDRAFPVFDDSGNVVRLAGLAADITERKLADEALIESEERFSSAFEFAPIGIALVSLNGRWLKVNRALSNLIGYSEQELQAQTFQDVTHPDDLAADLNYVNQILKGEINSYQTEKRYVHKSGHIVWVLLSVSLVKDSHGKPQYFISQIQDITERKQSEKEIARHLLELEALHENGLAVGRLLEPREIGERVIETFARYLSWHHVTIRLRKEDKDELELIAFNLPGMKEDEKAEAEQNFINHINKVGQGISGWVVQTGQSLRTGDVHAHQQYVDTHEGIRSGLYMPLKLGERVIGVISVESEAAEALTAQDERLLATLANQAAIAFENARLYQNIHQELSERKRAETAMRDSETHYRELADSITDIFFELDHNLHISYWNIASEALTGVAAKDAIGKPMREIFGENGEQDRIENICESVLKNRQPKMFETLFMLNDEQRSFEANAYPSMRGVSVVAKDVTDRKRSEAILQKRLKLMEYSAQHSLEEVMQKTVDYVNELTHSQIGFFHLMEADQSTPGLQTWSTEALFLFNIPASKGRHLALDQAGVWADALRQRCAVIHNDYESLADKKGLPEGHIKIKRELVIPIFRSEKIVAVMGIGNKPQEYTQQDIEIAERFADYAWDITERKQMETALANEHNQLAKRVEERTSDLSRANSNLARALRVKDEFLATMSHELRTPLNAILGLSESLAEQTAGMLNEKQLKYISTISESGHHLLSLINDILDLAKIDAGQITLDINKVDVNLVCQTSLRMIKQLAQKKNQEVMLEIDQGLGLIWADERRLKQMMVNLLSNAVKFTPEGGKLGLEIHGNKEENKVMITAWDNGIGVSEKDLTQLFLPFVQLDSGLARETTGTGLGLALVAQMARLHGGSVSAVSQPGKGSRFTIALPWEPALPVDTIQRLRNTGKLPALKPDEGKRPTILLIEDTQAVTMMISDYLQLNGYKVVTAQDGVEGIAQAKNMRPDLILMDIMMPRMDGLQATRKLRSEPEFKRTPIIALTALAMPNDRERCLAAGMDEYISKPVNLKVLVKIIQSCLSSEEETKP